MITAAPHAVSGAVPSSAPLDAGPRQRRRKRLGGLLITGFGPFPGHLSNPSEELARESGHEIRILEVSFRGLRNFFDHLDPDPYETILMMGAHGSATTLHLELLAYNWNGRHPDVHGEKDEGPIYPAGRGVLVGSLWQSLELDELLGRYPMRLSYHPGSYFCNRVYYEAISRYPGKRIGFLHVPRAGVLAMPTQKECLSRLLEQIAATQSGDDRSGWQPRPPLLFP